MDVREKCEKAKDRFVHFIYAGKFVNEVSKNLRCVALATFAEYKRDPLMFSGKTRLNEEKERFAMQLPKSLKNEIEEFAGGHGITLSDVARVSSEAYINGYLPVIGSIPCGPLQEVLEAEVYYEMVPPYMKPRKGDFLLEASGDSMSPRIESGDLVLLRPGIDYSNGDICAVQVFENEDRINVKSTLKKLLIDHKQKIFILQPINEDYESEAIPFNRLEVLAVSRGLLKATSAR